MKRTENLHTQDKAKEKDAQCARAQPAQAEASSVASRAVRSFRKKQTNRKSVFELSESRVEDEHSSARAALEVKSQETLCVIMFGFEQTEIKFR